VISFSINDDHSHQIKIDFLIFLQINQSKIKFWEGIEINPDIYKANQILDFISKIKIKNIVHEKKLFNNQK
jgi:hypothetical protein